MTMFAVFDALDPAPDYASIDVFLADWDQRQRTEAGSSTCMHSAILIPQAPVLACECLSDLTRYLCAQGRAEEARREVEAFTERYPRGSFRNYEFHDHRYGRSVRIAVTKREQATLRRIERTLGRVGEQATATP